MYTDIYIHISIYLSIYLYIYISIYIKITINIFTYRRRAKSRSPRDSRLRRRACSAGRSAGCR